MALGKVALGTGWSGNLDFMTAKNSLLVAYRLVQLQRDEYPHWLGQSWAEADIGHAAALLRPLLADGSRGRTLALRGQLDVLRSHGHRAVGLRIVARLREIAASSPKLAALMGTSPRRSRGAPVLAAAVA